MVSPYYVDPGMDWSQGLAGLQQGIAFGQKKKLLEQEQNEKKREQERKALMTEAALAAYKSGDPDQVAQVVLTYPEIGTTMGTLLERKEEYSENQYTNSLEEMLTDIETTGNIKSDTTAGMSAFDTPYPGATVPKAEGDLTKEGVIKSIYQKNPKLGKKLIESEFAQLDNSRYNAWKKVHRPAKDDKMSSIMRMYNEWKELPEGDPGKTALASKLWPEESGTEVAPSNIQKMINERNARMLELAGQGLSTDEIEKDPDIMGFNRKIRGEQKEYKASPIMQMWHELEDEKVKLKKQGLSDEEINNHPLIRALNNRIMGIDIDMAEFEPEQIDFWGAHVLLTGKMPSLGRGKQATKLRAEIARSAAKQAYDLFGLQYPGGTATALSAALEAVATSKDTNVIGMALGILEKQYATMGSFVTNLNKQAAKAKELAAELPKIAGFDNRIMNYSLRKAIQFFKGDARYSKYSVYLAEISRELNKLASGATASIAAPSTEENKIWDRLIDKDLPLKDMISLLNEVEPLANLRVNSVLKQLDKTRTRMRTREIPSVEKSQGKTNADQDYQTISTQEEFDALPPGAYYVDDETGQTGRKP